MLMLLRIVARIAHAFATLIRAFSLSQLQYLIHCRALRFIDWNSTDLLGQPQPVLMMIDYHHLASALEGRGQRGHQSYWSSSVNYDGVAGRHACKFSGMPTGWENVGEHHIVELFLRILRFRREPQAIEVAVREAKIVGLSTVEGS